MKTFARFYGIFSAIETLRKNHRGLGTTTGGIPVIGVQFLILFSNNSKIKVIGNDVECTVCFRVCFTAYFYFAIVTTHPVSIILSLTRGRRGRGYIPQGNCFSKRSPCRNPLSKSRINDRVSTGDHCLVTRSLSSLFCPLTRSFPGKRRILPWGPVNSNTYAQST